MARQLEELSRDQQPIAADAKDSQATSDANIKATLIAAKGTIQADGARQLSAAGGRTYQSQPALRRRMIEPHAHHSAHEPLVQAFAGAEPEPAEPSPRRWTWRDLIPDCIYGLASDRTLAIVGAAIVSVCVIAGGIWWGPFSNADGVEPGLIISPSNVRGYITSLAIAENGTLAAGRTHGQVEIWDTTAPRLIETLSTVRGKYVALSRDGSHLIAGDEQQSRIVQLTTGTVTMRDCGIRSIAVNAAGTHAVSLTSDNGVLAWDLAAGNAPQRLQLGTDNISAIVLSPDGRHCAVGTPAGAILVMDLDGGKVTRRIVINRSGGVTALAVDGSGDRIAAITSDNRLHVLKGEIHDKDWGEAFWPGIPYVSKVHWLGENQVLTAGGRELAICSLGEKPQTWKVDVHSIDALAVSPDRCMAAVGCRDEPAIVLLDLTTRQRSGILDTHEN